MRWLEQPQIWVCSQVSAARGMRIHPCCVILIYSSLNSGYVLPYYDVNGPRRCFSLSLIIMALVVSSAKFVSRKSSLYSECVRCFEGSTYWRANCESHEMEDLLIHRVMGKCILRYWTCFALDLSLMLSWVCNPLAVLIICCWDVTLNLCICGAKKLNTSRIGMFMCQQGLPK